MSATATSAPSAAKTSTIPRPIPRTRRSLRRPCPPACPSGFWSRFWRGRRGGEGDGLGAGDGPYRFGRWQEPRVVERHVGGVRGAPDADEEHERRSDVAVEAEVVRPAGPHRRRQPEAGLPE